MATWTLLFGPATTPHPVQPVAPASGSGAPAPGGGSGSVHPETQPPVNDAAAAASPGGVPGAAGPPGTTAYTPIRASSKEEFRVITSTQDIRLSNEGGCATWWRLTRYTINGGVPVDLIPDLARTLGVLPLQVGIDGDQEATRLLSKALYTHEVSDIPAGDPSGVGPGKRVSFKFADGNGLAVSKVLEVPELGYLGR